MRFLWLLPLAGLLQPPAAACPPGRLCSCVALPSAEVARDSADAVFLGSVTAVRDTMVSDAGAFVPARVAVVRVEKHWKGSVVGGEARVLTGWGSGDCGFPFEPGRQYLVYARRGAEGLSTSACSRTAPVEAARADLALLGTPAAQP